MIKIKVIDLLNKIANGEEVPKRIRIDHWCYEFEWVEHDENYYDKHHEIDLMSCLSMSEEELNYEVKLLKEDKKIEKLNMGLFNKNDVSYTFGNKINEIIDQLNEMNDK